MSWLPFLSSDLFSTCYKQHVALELVQRLFLSPGIGIGIGIGIDPVASWAFSAIAETEAASELIDIVIVWILWGASWIYVPF